MRLNDDATTPADNPFFSAGAAIGGEAGANIQRIFAYGLRNTFGLAFDPLSGNLWDEQNGDDTFDELNGLLARHLPDVLGATNAEDGSAHARLLREAIQATL